MSAAWHQNLNSTRLRWKAWRKALSTRLHIRALCFREGSEIWELCVRYQLKLLATHLGCWAATGGDPEKANRILNETFSALPRLPSLGHQEDQEETTVLNLEARDGE